MGIHASTFLGPNLLAMINIFMWSRISMVIVRLCIVDVSSIAFEIVACDLQVSQHRLNYLQRSR